ncbi:hypothetical protein B0H19DRAFT_1131786 [Mycena capillaripes]|nr:hypothetical protein B0H19DRAFT_1131786 [Mycena capillaripes]
MMANKPAIPPIIDVTIVIMSVVLGPPPECAVLSEGLELESVPDGGRADGSPLGTVPELDEPVGDVPVGSDELESEPEPG